MKIYSAVFRLLHAAKHGRISVSIVATLYCECVENESTVFNDANVIPGSENVKSKRNVIQFSMRAVVQRNLQAFSERRRSQDML